MKAEGNSQPIRNPEELRDFAQAYFSGEFPNPDREGCPGAERVESLIQSAALPDTEMRLHLFNCSDCFLEYREAQARYAQATELQPAFRRRISLFNFRMTPVRGLVAAALLLLLAGSGITFYLLSWHSQSSLIMPPAFEPAPGTANASSDPATDLPMAPGQQEPADFGTRNGSRSGLQSRLHNQRLRQPIETRIDLSEDVTRAAESGRREQGGNNKIIKLPPRRMSIVFDLPDNSSKGLYAVTIVDPFGKVLISRNGISRDGKTLKVFLDLRQLVEAKYRLCVSHLNEAPACYQILIGDRP